MGTPEAAGPGHCPDRDDEPRRVASLVRPEESSRLELDGYFVIADAFHADTIDDLLEDANGGADGGDALRRFCGHPLFAGLARDLVGPDAYLLGASIIAAATGAPGWARFGTGGSATDPHRHSDAAPEATSERFVGITCWVALTPADAEHGGLAVLRRGHHPDGPATETPISLRPGSLVVLSADTPRRVLPNPAGPPTAAAVLHFGPEPTPIVLAADTEIELLPSQSRAVVRAGQLVRPT